MTPRAVPHQPRPDERRDGIDRRLEVPVCQECGGELVTRGQRSIGVRIQKCATCGIMDERSPDDRRKPWTPAPRVLTFPPATIDARTLVRWVLLAIIVGAVLGVVAYELAPPWGAP